VGAEPHQVLADTQAIAFMLRVEPYDIRHWASRYPGELPRRGTRHGRTLYDVDDALRVAQRLHRLPLGTR
jgi:DNA-binding transcriptional MerR regulator